jgi:hypothetical protein
MCSIPRATRVAVARLFPVVAVDPLFRELLCLCFLLRLTVGIVQKPAHGCLYIQTGTTFSQCPSRVFRCKSHIHQLVDSLVPWIIELGSACAWLLPLLYWSAIFRLALDLLYGLCQVAQEIIIIGSKRLLSRTRPPWRHLGQAEWIVVLSKVAECRTAYAVTPCLGLCQVELMLVQSVVVLLSGCGRGWIVAGVIDLCCGLERSKQIIVFVYSRNLASSIHAGEAGRRARNLCCSCRAQMGY